MNSNIVKRIKQLLGTDIGYNVNLITGKDKDVTNSQLVAHWKEASGTIYQCSFVAIADATGGSNTPLQKVAASELNPHGFTVTNGHAAGSATYTLVFTIANPIPGLTFNADKMHVLLTKEITGANDISETLRVTAVDNTAGGTTVGFTVGLSSANASTPITATVRFNLEVVLI